MAVTRVTDIIVPEVFYNYIINETPEKSALFRSGIIQTDPRIVVPDGGDTVNMPFFNDLDGDPEAIQSNHALTPANIDTGKDVARVLLFGKAWSSEDLAAELAGADPMTAIANRVLAYWDRQYQKILLKILDGVFADNATNDNGDLIHDISIDAGATATAANKISAEAILDAAQLLGDAKDKFTAIAMHSVVHTALQKQGLIDFIPDHEANVGWGTYLDKSVIVDDGLPVADGATSGKKYTTYLFAGGAVGYAEGTPKVPVETDRNTLKGEDILIHRRKFIMHPRGIKWTEGDVADEMPTLAELAKAANWDRVYDKKKIRVVKIVTNG